MGKKVPARKLEQIRRLTDAQTQARLLAKELVLAQGRRDLLKLWRPSPKVLAGLPRIGRLAAETPAPPEAIEIPDPDPTLLRSLKGNSRVLFVCLWPRDNVSIEELRAVLHEEARKRNKKAKPPTDKAVKDAIDYLGQKLTKLGCAKTTIKSNGGLYFLAHPQK